MELDIYKGRSIAAVAYKQVRWYGCVQVDRCSLKRPDDKITCDYQWALSSIEKLIRKCVLLCSRTSRR